MDRLNISEIFSSLQGEGPYTGELVKFLRFSGCNLRCEWKGVRCDTPYASWEAETQLLTEAEIVARLEELIPDSRAVVITGGEPTLQTGLASLCSTLKRRGYRLDLETNGLGPVPDEIDTIVCSPKLSDSTPFDSKYSEMHERERVKLHPSISGSDPRLYLKFVVAESTSLPEIERCIERIGCPRERVYLMPMGIMREDILSRSELVSQICLEQGYQFSTRLHILLWGNERGR